MIESLDDMLLDSRTCSLHRSQCPGLTDEFGVIHSDRPDDLSRYTFGNRIGRGDKIVV